MARTPEQRGPFGRWLVGERKSRGWTADTMRARLQEARGFAMAHSTYALLESGQRQPTEEQRAHLTAFLGTAPAPEPVSSPAPAPDLAALIAAIERQQEQIVALQGMVQSLVRAIEQDRQGPPWLDDAVPAAARYILSAVRPGKASEP